MKANNRKILSAELTLALLRFDEPTIVVAYGDQYSQWLYYLATVADKVIVNPEGSISWHGNTNSC